MQEIRNADKRLVCRIDTSGKIVEIVVKGCKTQIQFLDGGKVKVENARMSA